MIFEDMDRIVFAGDSVTDMGSELPVGEGQLAAHIGNRYGQRAARGRGAF